MGFGLVIRFTGFLDTLSDHTLQFIITHAHAICLSRSLSLSSVHSHVVTVVALWHLLTADVPLSQNVPGHSHQHLTAVNWSWL
jgi:hypothetical protein